MVMNYKLEICVDTVESALNAQVAGADRIELCNNLAEGGTTPGFGTIITSRNNLTIGVNVIIRPRGGDFLYTDLEYDIMRRDIDLCGENGVDGIVLGILRSDGSIDVERNARLVEFAKPMTVTFHRAFDMCTNPEISLEDVIDTGAEKLLTSGQKNNVSDGVELIARLVQQAGNRIIIMPGGGLNLSNIDSIARTSKAKEFHLTGRKIRNSDMVYRKEGISMSGSDELSEFFRKVADTDMIRSIIEILKNI